MEQLVPLRVTTVWAMIVVSSMMLQSDIHERFPIASVSNHQVVRSLLAFLRANNPVNRPVEAFLCKCKLEFLLIRCDDSFLEHVFDYLVALLDLVILTLPQMVNSQIVLIQVLG